MYRVEAFEEVQQRCIRDPGRDQAVIRGSDL